jgi:SAM-dependent methyltransferase
LAFEVEALCHAHDASQAFSEVYRVLRPGGRFVIFDGFRDDDLTKYSDEIKIAVRLVELTMSVETFSPLTEWLTIAKSAGFTVLSTTDLSNAILPNLEKFQFLARGFYKFPKLNNLLGRVLSPALLKNSVAGLLMPFTVSSGAQKYNLVILEKPSAK